ncbi:MAG: hypothetical protein Q9201_001771 [Fulgogasparrea decipioides]
MAYPAPPASRASKRSRVQDSSSSGSDMSITPDGRSHTIERYRVGIPALQLLPMLSIDPPPSLPAVSKVREFMPKIVQILREKNIDFDDENAQSWYDAAKDIRGLFLSHSLTRPIKVELLSWQLIIPRVIGVVEDSHPLVAAWPSINPRIHTIIDEYPKLKNGWRSIDVLRIGYRTDEFRSTPVTISVTVDWDLNRVDWMHAEQRIEAILNSAGLSDVEVEFERGEINQTAFPLHKPTRASGLGGHIVEDYPQRLPMGSNFGPDKYFRAGHNGPLVHGPFATIGGYLEMRVNGGPVKKYAVACYHCVREAIEGFAYIEAPGPYKEIIKADVPHGSLLKLTDKNGMGPGMLQERRATTFEAPSRRAHNFTLQYHDQKIEQLKVDITLDPGIPENHQLLAEHVASKARKIKFFDDGRHRLGNLYLCSGYRRRTSKNGIIDIALLEIDEARMGNNRVPDKSAWRSDFDAPSAACGSLLEDMASCDPQSLLGRRVYKVGARTGATTGRINHVKSDVNMDWNAQEGMGFSTEYCFVADPNTLARRITDRGDSGAFVFTNGRKWIGVAVGGPVKANEPPGGSLVYVTDAEETIKWIQGIGSPGKYQVRLVTS